MNQKFWNIISSDLPLNHDLEILRKIILCNFIIFLGGFFLALLSLIAYIQDNLLLCLADLIFLFILFGLFLYLRKTKKHTFAAVFGSINTGIFYVFLIAAGGVSNTAYVWAFSYPLVALFLLGARTGTIFSFILLGFASLVFMFSSKISFLTTYSTNLIVRFISVYITIYFISLIMERLREIVQGRLEKANQEMTKTVRTLKKTNSEKEDLIKKLQKIIKEVEQLKGILPICANCKKIRNDSGYWEQVEKYIQEHSKAKFSHGLCPDCTRKFFNDKD